MRHKAFVLVQLGLRPCCAVAGADGTGSGVEEEGRDGVKGDDWGGKGGCV